MRGCWKQLSNGSCKDAGNIGASSLDERNNIISMAPQLIATVVVNSLFLKESYRIAEVVCSLPLSAGVGTCSRSYALRAALPSEHVNDLQVWTHGEHGDS